MKIIIIDNYDSFTYNLAHYCEQFCEQVDVFRNDEITAAKCADYDGIILSPGPGLPKDAGITMQVLQQWHDEKPILGVCLGHQAIGEFYGACLYNMKEVMHGIQSTCTLTQYPSPLFESMPSAFEVGHYHSWAVDEETLPSCLRVTAKNNQGIVMAMQHTEYPVVGVQFHPESILTPHGLTMIANWIRSL